MHETSALVSLRERATHSRRKLTRAKRLSSSQETALGRLPAPDETYSPLVWAGWNALADELEGDGRGHCFFRPDLPADDEESTEILGALTVVPVSGLSAERIEKGRAPSYLSRSGIDRGKPYWTRASSPWAASGYGAFGSLSEAIAAMPADWEPARGAARVERAVESARTASPSSRAGASPWARTALLGIAAIAALVAGIVGGLHDADQMEKVYSAELGAPGSLVADPAAAQEQVIAELVADSADGPAVTPLSRAGLVGVGLADIGDAADSVADELGREVRVIGLDSATTGVVDSADTEDLIADALPDGALAVVLDYRSAELVAAGIRDDYRGGSPERPQFDADATVTDEALGQLRWASQVSWIPDDGVSGGLSDSDDEDEAEFMPAPDTAEWENRTWVRTLMGAIGAALAVIVVGVLCRGLVVDRTDPTAKAKKRSGSGTRKRAAGGERPDVREAEEEQTMTRLARRVAGTAVVLGVAGGGLAAGAASATPVTGASVTATSVLGTSAAVVLSAAGGTDDSGSLLGTVQTYATQLEEESLIADEGSVDLYGGGFEELRELQDEAEVPTYIVFDSALDFQQDTTVAQLLADVLPGEEFVVMVVGEGGYMPAVEVVAPDEDRTRLLESQFYSTSMSRGAVRFGAGAAADRTGAAAGPGARDECVLRRQQHVALDPVPDHRVPDAVLRDRSRADRRRGGRAVVLHPAWGEEEALPDPQGGRARSRRGGSRSHAQGAGRRCARCRRAAGEAPDRRHRQGDRRSRGARPRRLRTGAQDRRRRRFAGGRPRRRDGAHGDRGVRGVACGGLHRLRPEGRPGGGSAWVRGRPVAGPRRRSCAASTPGTVRRRRRSMRTSQGGRAR